MSLKPMQKKHLDLYSDDIKFFFIEFDNNINKDIEEIGDFIYVKGNELPLVPNMLVKTLLCIEYIKNKYEYDYIIRTNITTLWNIKVLLSLYNTIPRNNFFGGHYMFDSFISGTGIIISNDLIPLLLKTNILDRDNDDVVISKHMKDSVPVYRLNNHSQFKLIYQVLDENCKDTSSPHHINHNKIPETTDDVLYFRICSASNEYDLNVTKLLINKLSNIEVI